ncbi:MAG: tRNA (uridine(34)/cytosine(34)/5-carboxymethylaminomethyluridine(34)-2'-O)-methyltransferase TrmL [Bdellovibrionales bacterium GWB1_55_8]|nr:MAG: tRNA (uridine(34)/cytosine(34)/5-carboxymethylaminomethyluridine(34)-2'-O)-methyltransferase TrmL [Bdellovibrionales bacterium GWB1_55_8]
MKLIKPEERFGLNVVLVEPEIPQNTGTIGRLCLATGSTLHLVEPLGFEITDARLKRAGLDYWEHLRVIRHANLEAFLKTLPPNAPKILFSKKAGHTLYEHKIEPGSYLIFGRETFGLPESLIASYPTDTVRIPMYDARVRSLNLSNTVSIAVYEAIRQIGVGSDLRD